METTPAPAAHRSERTATFAVGGLSLLAGALYVWVVFALLTSGADAPASLLGYTVFAAALGIYLVSALATGSTDLGLALPLWFSVFALTAYRPSLVRASRSPPGGCLSPVRRCTSCWPSAMR